MRKFFLTALFALGMFSISFAADKSSDKLKVKESKATILAKKSKKSKKVKGCVSFLLSCGVEGTLCSDDMSDDSLSDVVIILDGAICN